MPTFEVNLLWGSVHLCGAPISLSKREAEFVVALALHQPCDPSDVADLLWPEADGDRARFLFKTYVHRVRGKLGSPFLDCTRGGYRIADFAVVDVDVIRTELEAFRFLGSLASIELPALLIAARRLRLERPIFANSWNWFAPVARRWHAIGRDFALDIARQALHAGDLRLALAIARQLCCEDIDDADACEIARRANCRFPNTASAPFALDSRAHAHVGGAR